jgi:NADPH:quinone reductase-like Zn-dependent oxidoreductase
LIDQAELCEGETILVHDAASTVGQATVSMAQMIGANVWTTVRSSAEKTLMRTNFSLSEERILYDGNEDFAESIQEATCGHGMDVVFDTLTDSHLVMATRYSLADFGRHIIIGNHRIRNSTSTRLNTSTISVDIDSIIKHRPRVIQRLLANVARMLKHDAIQPAHAVKTYDISNVAAALHDVQLEGPHGKVVIAPQEDDLVMVSAEMCIIPVVLTL